MSLFITDESDEEQLVLELSRQEDDRQKEDKEVSTEALYPLIPDDGDLHIKPNIEEIRPVDIQLSLPLHFQQLIVEDLLVSEDSLLILGKGLGIEPIVANLLHILATPTRIDGKDKRSLVLVLNANEEDNDKIREELLELAWSYDGEEEQSQRPFKVVTSDLLTVERRRKLYLHGGIISVTSRILIVDLLSGIIHPNKITGLLIMHVESLHNYSNESFITEMYRSVNKWGFIKAVSDQPEAFMSDFSPIRRKLRDLRLKRTLLWPRFHVDISSSLNSRQGNKVIEVKVSLTNSMSQIQFGLFECLKKCTEELNRKNPALALESWNADNCLHPNFLKSLYAVLTPNWHRISFESKQLLKDIGTLKKLLHALISYDSVDFYEIIQMILDVNKPSVSRKYYESPWLMAEESQAVLSYAKKRVFSDARYELEDLPKWEQLSAILDDISLEQSHSTVQHGPTLILCSEDRTCRQLQKIIGYSNRKEGTRRYMLRKLRAYMNRRDSLKKTAQTIQEQSQTGGLDGELSVSRSFAKEEVISKRRRTRGSAAVAAVTRLKTASNAGEDIDSLMSIGDIESHLSQIIEDTDTEIPENSNEEELALEDEGYEENDVDIFELQPMFEGEKGIPGHGAENLEYVDRGDQIIIERFYNKSNDLLLQEIMPTNIIMYEPDLSFIRRVELFKAVHKDWPLKVYFMYYGDSVEEQSHLIAIKKEKDAYTRLIREHTAMAQHFEADEDLSRYKNLAQRKLASDNKKFEKFASGRRSEGS